MNVYRSWYQHRWNDCSRNATRSTTTAARYASPNNRGSPIAARTYEPHIQKRRAIRDAILKPPLSSRGICLIGEFINPDCPLHQRNMIEAVHARRRSEARNPARLARRHRHWSQRQHCRHRHHHNPQHRYHLCRPIVRLNRSCRRRLRRLQRQKAV